MNVSRVLIALTLAWFSSPALAEPDFPLAKLTCEIECPFEGYKISIYQKINKDGSLAKDPTTMGGHYGITVVAGTREFFALHDDVKKFFNGIWPSCAGCATMVEIPSSQKVCTYDGVAVSTKVNGAIYRLRIPTTPALNGWSSAGKNFGLGNCSDANAVKQRIKQMGGPALPGPCGKYCGPIWVPSSGSPFWGGSFPNWGEKQVSVKFMNLPQYQKEVVTPILAEDAIVTPGMIQEYLDNQSDGGGDDGPGLWSGASNFNNTGFIANMVGEASAKSAGVEASKFALLYDPAKFGADKILILPQAWLRFKTKEPVAAKEAAGQMIYYKAWMDAEEAFKKGLPYNNLNLNSWRGVSFPAVRKFFWDNGIIPVSAMESEATLAGYVGVITSDVKVGAVFVKRANISLQIPPVKFQYERSAPVRTPDITPQPVDRPPSRPKPAG